MVSDLITSAVMSALAAITDIALVFEMLCARFPTCVLTCVLQVLYSCLLLKS
jgi:hypothetical protein